MTSEDIIPKTLKYLKEEFDSKGAAHDYWHLYRVWRLAKHIASKEEGVDMLVLELAALLHDVGDWKLTDDGQDDIGQVGKWLKSQGVGKDVIENVQDSIRNTGFRHSLDGVKLVKIEAQIVHDADKLDALGAIGIARAFDFGGSKGKIIHDPSVALEHFDSSEAYKAQKHNTNPTINHFYEKLLLIKDRMYTKTGKQMARHRHKVVEEFLDEFHAEWDGKR